MDENEARPLRNVRALLELDLAALATRGVIPDRGDREIVLRLDDAGFIRWLSATVVRMPASALEVV